MMAELQLLAHKFPGHTHVRILDQAEVLDVRPGSKFTVQVLDYEKGDYTITHPRIMGLQAVYKFVREELKYEGPIRFAVAGERP